MSDPQPICPRCGLYLVVRGCTAEACARPERGDYVRLHDTGVRIVTTNSERRPYVVDERGNQRFVDDDRFVYAIDDMLKAADDLEREAARLRAKAKLLK